MIELENGNQGLILVELVDAKKNDVEKCDPMVDWEKQDGSKNEFL